MLYQNNPHKIYWSFLYFGTADVVHAKLSLRNTNIDNSFAGLGVIWPGGSVDISHSDGLNYKSFEIERSGRVSSTYFRSQGAFAYRNDTASPYTCSGDTHMSDKYGRGTVTSLISTLPLESSCQTSPQSPETSTTVHKNIEAGVTTTIGVCPLTAAALGLADVCTAKYTQGSIFMDGLIFDFWLWNMIYWVVYTFIFIVALVSMLYSYRHRTCFFHPRKWELYL